MRNDRLLAWLAFCSLTFGLISIATVAQFVGLRATATGLSVLLLLTGLLGLMTAVALYQKRITEGFTRFVALAYSVFACLNFAGFLLQGLNTRAEVSHMIISILGLLLALLIVLTRE